MPPKTEITKTLLATCRDNLGLEDKFDQGIEYVAEEHHDPDMVWVVDNFGVRQECFKSRFSLRIEEEVDVTEMVVDAVNKSDLETLIKMADVIMGGKSGNGITDIQRGWLGKAMEKYCECCDKEEETEDSDWCNNCNVELEENR
jgi:hypothetical protein